MAPMSPLPESVSNELRFRKRFRISAVATRVQVTPVTAALGGILIVAAVLRFATLTGQSLWYDEAQTLGLVSRPFDEMLSGLSDPGLAEPPLYFVLAWGWVHIFGTGADGLRSLSAVLGLMTVP